MAEIFRPPFFQVENAAGIPLSGAKLYFYATGTETPITVYQDVTLVTPHASPVVADANGTFPSIYLGQNTYKIALYTGADVLVKTVDNINTTAAGSTVLDGTFRIQNTSDATKQIAFSAAGITTGTTRNYTGPDKDGTLALTSDIPSTTGFVTGTKISTPTNLGLAVSVAASALTIALKGADGNDPSASNAVIVPFRSVTASTGTPDPLTITGAVSLTISSGSTMGMTSTVAATLAIVMFNDAGTARLGLINPLLLPLIDGIGSSTAEGGAGGADSAGVIYTGTAVTSKAYTVIAFVTLTEATAGTWASGPTILKISSDAELPSVLPMITPWVAYTPTFTGFGTVSGVSMFSKRIGDTLHVMGKFTAGTSTAVEARMTLGFNGTNSNVTSDATKVPSIRDVGSGSLGTAATQQFRVLVEQSVGYITFGIQNSGAGGLTKAVGSDIVTGNTFGFTAQIPISGW